MNAKSLSIHSEAYSPTGNLAAEGHRKLLGAPSIDLLQTLVREAVQNCCDAAKKNKGPEITFRLRRLGEVQVTILRDQIFRDLPKPERSEAAFRNFLGKDSPWVLEICDFDTIGLAGPTRADRIPPGDEPTDFIDFLRNVGSSRDTPEGGGTYGYGKSSLYLSSRCSTILVDSQTTFLDTPVRRIFACHLGSAHEIESSGVIERRTGRHWWGVRSGSDPVVDPIEGAAGEEIANALGFLPRNPSRPGTSVMILDPFFVDEGNVTPEILMGMIAETLLWYFWPRLMANVDPAKKVNITLQLDGEKFPFPEPEQFPPLDVFSQAMNELRENSSSTTSLESRKYNKPLGRVNIKKGIRSARSNIVPRQHSIIPSVASHLAVMRPVELVVRYFEGDPLPDKRVEWGGVFVADRDREVEKAFAKAEPPAHDDWQSQLMPKGRQQTFVNVAVRKLKEIAKGVAAPSVDHTASGDDGPSLASLSSKLGRFLDESMGQGAGTPGPKKRGSGGSTRRKRFSQPVFHGLEIFDERSTAIFTVDIRNSDGSKKLLLTAHPSLVADGGALASSAVDTEGLQVHSWSTDEGDFLGKGDTAEIGQYSGTLNLRLFIPEDAAITVKLSETIGG